MQAFCGIYMTLNSTGRHGYFLNSTCDMKPIDMRQGFKEYSDMRQAYFLNSTCDMAINKRQRYATLPFLKIDMRPWGPHQGPHLYQHAGIQRKSQLNQRETQRELVEYGRVGLIRIGVRVGCINFILFVQFFLSTQVIMRRLNAMALDP